MCDGSAISRETYSDLFAVIGTTYGNGDGSATFNVPNLVDKFVQGSTTAGTVKDAGLPDITGSFGVRRWGQGAVILSETGSFYRNGYEGVEAGNLSSSGSTTLTAQEVRFSASKSSAIYGNSTTVQPPAIGMKYAIYSGVVSKKCWLRTI